MLLVHGIGNQKHGSLLTRMAQPCVQALASLAHARGFTARQTIDLRPSEVTPRTNEPPRSTSVTLTKGETARSVLFVEAVWSDAFSRPRWWQCVFWALRSLPAAVLLFSPDRRDAGLVAPEEREPRPTRGGWVRRGIREATRLDFLFQDEHLGTLRLASRVLLAGLLLGFPLAALVRNPGLVIPLMLLVGIYLASRHSVVGHVVVAATDSDELAKIRDRVDVCLDWAQERSKRMMVVAHSQGGYLSHAVLSDGGAARRGVAAFIGVGSGLKPIWLLRQLNRRKVLAAAWVTVAAMVAGESFAIPVLAGLTPSMGAAAKSLLETGGELVAPLGAVQSYDPDDVREMLDLQVQPVTGLYNALGDIGALQVAAFAVFIAGIALSRPLWKSAYRDEQGSGPAPVVDAVWMELSSYHDPVGRMLLPVLPPPAEEQAVPVGGHPAGDHVAYFSTGSIVPWRVAGTVMTILGERCPPTIATVEEALRARADRRRVLRSEILAAVLLVTTLPLIIGGSSPLAAISAAGFTLLLWAIGLSVIFTASETYAHRRALREMSDGLGNARVPALRLPVARAKRVLPTVLLLVVVISAFSVTVQLINWPVPGSESATSFGYLTIIAFGYLVAVGAGYRANRWGLVAGVTVCALGHISTVPLVPHAQTVPGWLALPGGTALVLIAIMTVWVAVLLRPRRLA